MSNSPLDQHAIEKVRTWLDTSNVVVSVTLSVAQRERSIAAWELKETYEHLGPVKPKILLPRDFPFSPLRVELDPSCCLRLPHVEASGTFCHGVLPAPADIDDPVIAAGRVLERFLGYVRSSADSDWVEAEFHRESHDYWLRHVAASNPPKGFRTDELLLEIDPELQKPQRVEALHLANRLRAIVSSRQGGPMAVAQEIGWSLGTIVHGSALIARLPQGQRWTPTTWPNSFGSLSALVDEITGSQGIVTSWIDLRQWPHDAPLFLVLLQGSIGYGWRIVPSRACSSSQARILPVKVSRIDRRWTLARDHHSERLAALADKRVVVFGCGSVGAPIAELLARAGVGSIEVVDPDLMRPENISRHPLGMKSNGLFKANELCQRLKAAIPGVKMKPHTVTAQSWLAAGYPAPDLVLDCTGDRAARMALFHVRATALGSAPVIMTWLEPFAAASHVITVAGDDQWPASDPAETAINIAKWPDDVEITHPGCGQGFHPYGMSDALETAALAARRAIALLHQENCASDVLSLIQAREYFERMWPGITFNREILSPSGAVSVVERRALKEALYGF